MTSQGRWAVGIAVWLITSPSLRAQEVVAGWEGEGGRRGYAFVAPTVPLNDNAGRQLVLRTSASFLYYRIDHGEDTELVRSPGAAVGLGLHMSRSRMTFAVVPGYEIRRTVRRRAATGLDAPVFERGPTLQGEMFVRATETTSVMVLGSYGHANRYTWLRGGVSRGVGTPGGSHRALRVGFDTTVQGNTDLQTIQAGPAFEIGIGPAMSLQARVGYSRQRAGPAPPANRAYAAVGLYRRF